METEGLLSCSKEPPTGHYTLFWSYTIKFLKKAEFQDGIVMW
jgi:hypothetical protein